MTAQPGTTKPKRYSISIRAMMLIILIFGVLMGRQVNKARIQRKTVSSVARMTGYVVFDHDINSLGKYAPNASPPWAPKWLQSLIGPEYFRTVYSITLHRSIYQGERDLELGSAFFEALSDLRSLNLSHNQFPDEDWSAALASMPYLVRLYLMDCTNVGTRTVEVIGRMNQLEELYLSHTGVDDADLIHLRGLKKLKVLYLGELPITDSGLVHLEGLTGLQALALNGTKVTDASLVHLKKLTALKELSLEGSGVTESGVAELRKALPATKINWTKP